MLACARTCAVRVRMSAKVFLPQEVVDSWITADKVELSGEVMTLRELGVALRLVPGFYFDHVAGGSDEGHNLLGRAKSKAAVAALGAEAYMNSVLLGETAYEVEAGFIAKPVDSGCPHQVLLAALARAGR
jgi:hypothetical protein